MTYFQVGDIVEATTEIRRKDNRSVLKKGDFATISHVSQVDKLRPQIVGITIQNQAPMGDIVCYVDGPFKILKYALTR